MKIGRGRRNCEALLTVIERVVLGGQGRELALGSLGDVCCVRGGWTCERSLVRCVEVYITSSSLLLVEDCLDTFFPISHSQSTWTYHRYHHG